MRIVSVALLFVLHVASVTRLTSKAITLRGDLDGDGRLENATVGFEVPDDGQGDRYETVDVSVGGRSHIFNCDYCRGDAAVVDVDQSDRWREIAVPQLGPSNDDHVLLFRYDGKSLELVGHVPGEDPIINGSGSIGGTCRGNILCTWFYPCAFRWSDAAGAFVEVPQTFKPMSVNVTLKTLLAISATPVMPFSPRVALEPGTKATIDLTDDVEWCHIRTDDGKTGWFHVQEGHYVSFPDNTDVQKVFEGLPLAD